MAEVIAVRNRFEGTKPHADRPVPDELIADDVDSIGLTGVRLGPLAAA